MTAAIFGLLGVVVGGVLNGVIAYALERRRERLVFRVVARELADDLVFIGGLIDRTLGDGDWIRWANALNAGRLELSWRQRRPLLASHLPAADYMFLARVVWAFEWFRDESPTTQERAEAALNDDDRRKLRGLYGEIFRSLRLLTVPAGIGRRPPRLRRLVRRLARRPPDVAPPPPPPSDARASSDSDDITPREPRSSVVGRPSRQRSADDRRRWFPNCSALHVRAA